MEGLSNIEVSELSRLAPIGPDWPRLAPTGPDYVVAASAPQTLPSTRAGGQDDVSLNKLPQINVYRFYVILYYFLLNVITFI